MDYENSLDISGLTFPLAVKDVPKFERQNPTISVNVLCRGDEGGFVPLHVSKEQGRPHHVNLFLVEGEDENKHYVWVKNLSRLVRGRTKHTGEKAFVCNHCLHAFSDKEIHDRHICRILSRTFPCLSPNIGLQYSTLLSFREDRLCALSLIHI